MKHLKTTRKRFCESIVVRLFGGSKFGWLRKVKVNIWDLQMGANRPLSLRGNVLQCL